VVNYIEKAGTPQKHIDISTHWLGKARDYEKVTGPLVQIRDLEMRFETKGSIFPSAGILPCGQKGQFRYHEGETFGLVGESGSGKSTIARADYRPLPPDRRVDPLRQPRN
jgi:peptide/nickel transport system ATP-binding protein